MAQAQWVSFQELKEKITMSDLLAHYGLLASLNPRRDGEELVGLCPFHQETRGSFHVSTVKNAWNCFGCQRKGNILDFVVEKESVNIREAGLLLEEWFKVVTEPPEGPAKALEVQDHTGGPGAQENPVLTFELKVDPKHPYLKERGLKKETIEVFGLGFCSRGLMKDRIAIPIHNKDGELVAYCGRWPGEDPPEGEEKYKMPAGFLKSSVLFNLHRVDYELVQDRGMIVTEGFFDAMRIYEAGYRNVVALMGASMSDGQKELLREILGPQGKVTLLFDGDEAGILCQSQCLEALAPHLYVKTVQLEDGLQPHGLAWA